MSNLLEQASLVMIPSGYKEDVVYSEIPINGAGDLSFTRASNGTRINSQGLVEVVPWNLATYSENFSALYGYLNASISNNTTSAPNATTTADSLLETTATDIHAIYGDYTQQSGVQYTYSVYVKSISGRNVRISGSSGFGGPIALVDLSNGTLLSGSTGASVESVGNGWYRISITATTTTTTVRVIIYSMDGTSTTFAGSTSNGVYVWGAQVNIGSTAKPYFPTTDRLNVPRLTYQNGGGGCPSLLLEKQSTNIATQSTITSFGTGQNDWVNGANSPASINQTTGIDGTQNGTKYTKTAGQTTNDDFYKNQVPVTSGTIYTVSGYIKLGTASNAVVVINNTLAWNSVPNGSIVCSTANGFSTTEWKRFQLTITGPSTNRINIHFGYHQETGVAAQATGTFFLDGFQIEASSYATSLIPTTSSSATRVVDALTLTSIPNSSATSYTIFVDFKSLVASNAGFYFSNSSGSIAYAFYFYGGTWNVFNGSAFITKYDITSTRGKIAIVHTPSSVKVFINGVNDTASGASSNNRLAQQIYFDLSGDRMADVNSIIYFPTPLTDAECQALTTI